MNNIVIIGAGGIGSWLLKFITPYLEYSEFKNKYKIKIVDGDVYTANNKERQTFLNFDNKAKEQFNILSNEYKNVIIEAYSEYLDEKNINFFIEEEDIVLVCVDNHKTRKILLEKLKEYKNILVISGGNEYYDGNVFIYMKINGEEKTRFPLEYHPEIATTKSKMPQEISCSEIILEEPQLIFTNVSVASTMANKLWGYLNDKLDPKKSESFIDIISGNVATRVR